MARKAYPSSLAEGEEGFKADAGTMMLRSFWVE